MDPDSSDLFIYAGLLAALILVNAFFAMSEIAVIQLNDAKIRRAAVNGDRNARVLVELLDSPTDFLATIQVGVTLSGFLASAVAADTFAEHIVLAVGRAGWPVPPPVVNAVSIVVITVVLSFFTLVFGELVPKRLAMEYHERIAAAVARPLRMIYRLERPFVVLLAAVTNLVLRPFGIGASQQPEKVTEEELRMMLDVGEESGNIEQSEKDMINNIFEFDDRKVEEMMTHRTEITAVEVGTPLEDIVRAAIDSGVSRIPVFEDDLDSIVGILHVKDLLEFVTVDSHNGFDVTQCMREPMYVPGSTTCQTLLKEFREKKVHLAVVVDEYGGTSGVVTMEDLIESIVGNIQDEYDDEEEYISPVSGNRYIVSGLAPMEDVAKFFDLAVEEDDDFDTIGGYVVNRLGYIPDTDEHPSVTVGRVLLTVRDMDDRRVDRIEVEITAPDGSETIA